MNNAKVSIIVPTYNRAHIIGRSVESVLAQTYADFELVLVDDGSTDETKELIESYQDERICYYYAGQNQGVSAARNYGIEKARYDYIAFQDSDDIWHPNKLEKQMQALLQAGADEGFVYHKIQYLFGENRFAIIPNEEVPMAQKTGDIFAQMLYDNLVPCPSILATRQCVLSTQGFDTQMKALEDYDFALKMAKNYKGIFLDEVLLDASYSATGVSGNVVNYLLGSCLLIQKYKADYLATNTLNHRLEIILRDAVAIGMEEQFIQLLEQIMKAGN